MSGGDWVEEGELDFGVDAYDDIVAFQVDGNDIVHVGPPDDRGWAQVIVFESSHPDAGVLWEGPVNLRQRADWEP
jgi:hypothetical protein